VHTGGLVADEQGLPDLGVGPAGRQPGLRSDRPARPGLLGRDQRPEAQLGRSGRREMLRGRG
jgi:hypothetical protein